MAELWRMPRLVRVKKDYKTNPPWDRTRIIRQGELAVAIPAYNQPEGAGNIHWWLKPLPGTTPEWECDTWDSSYGVGMEEDEVEVIHLSGVLRRIRGRLGDEIPLNKDGDITMLYNVLGGLMKPEKKELDP